MGDRSCSQSTNMTEDVTPIWAISSASVSEVQLPEMHGLQASMKDAEDEQETEPFMGALAVHDGGVASEVTGVDLLLLAVIVAELALIVHLVFSKITC